MMARECDKYRHPKRAVPGHPGTPPRGHRWRGAGRVCAAPRRTNRGARGEWYTQRRYRRYCEEGGEGAQPDVVGGPGPSTSPECRSPKRAAMPTGRLAEPGAPAHACPGTAGEAAWRAPQPPPANGGSPVREGRSAAQGRVPPDGPRLQRPVCSRRGLREGRAPKSKVRARWIAKLHSKGRILYDSCEGVPGNPAQRDSTPVGRQVVRCLSGGPTGLPGAVPLTSSAEPSCETRPPCGLRGRRPTGRSGRPHPDSNRRRGGAAGGRAGFSRRVPGVRSTRRYPAARGRSRVPYQ